MKKIYLIILVLFCYVLSFGQSGVNTPTGIPIYYETSSIMPGIEELAAANAHYDSLIVVNEWNAVKIGECSYKYNCHGYAWHLSDNGDTVNIHNVSDVAKYYNGLDGAATFKRVSNPMKYSKIYYNGGGHSAITDTNDPTQYVISKWGSGPLVRHLPNDCPYEGYTLEYYELKIDDSPSSVAIK